MTGYKAPTEEQLMEAVRRIITPQIRRAFFEGLENPLWLAPLARLGLFDTPPEPVKGDDGLAYDVYWPEVDYLIRVAGHEPKAVADVLLKLSSSNNAWLKRAVFTVGSKIPAEQAVRLLPLLKTWVSGDFGWRSDPREMVALAVNLLANGEHKSGIWIANVLFGSSRPKNDDQPTYLATPVLFLREHSYVHGLAEVVAVLQSSDLKVVLNWLLAYERASGHLTSDRDTSYLARESIRVREGLGTRRSAEQSLIESVRDLAVKAAHGNVASMVSTLLEQGTVLGRKIALYAIGEALSDEEIEREQEGALLAAATELLFDTKSRDHPYRIEYGELAQAVALRNPYLLEPLADFLGEGPLVELDELRRRVRRDTEETPEQVEAHLFEYLSRWKHKWLAAIGSDALPGVLRAELAELEAKHGSIENPLAPSRVVTTWTGPNSPISQDEMAAMEPTELVGYLESWHASGDGWGPEPSHDGLGRALTAILTTNPLAIAGQEGIAERLRPTYLRAIARGWEAALKAGIAADWTQVASVLRGVLTHSDELLVAPEGDEFDDDRDYRAAKKAAIGLLEELLKKRGDALIAADVLTAFADLLLFEGADEVAWDEYVGYEHEDDMDPLTISLNWHWPIRLHALVALLAHGEGSPWHSTARDEFEREIARVDRRGASRAVIGEALGRLLNTDPEWFEPKVPSLFGSSEGITRDQQIALTTAIAVHGYHGKLYELLSPSMQAALKLDTPLVLGWRHGNDPEQEIGEWVISAIALGHAKQDDPVAKAFFSESEPAARGAALGHIAWTLTDVPDLEKGICERLGTLWDERVDHVRECAEDKAELQDFYWFVRCRKFSPEWWLPRLKEAAELSEGTFSTNGMVGKSLAIAASAHPRAAFDALKVLLGQRGADADLTSYDLHDRAAPTVIARALESGDKELGSEATELMNQMGASGFRELEDRVNAVLAGTAPYIEDD